MSWQQDDQDARRAAESALTRAARSSMAEFVETLMPWTLFVNPATFDSMEIAGAAAGDVRPDAKLRTDGATAQGRLNATGTLPPPVSDATALRRFRGWLNRYAREALGRPVEGLIALEHGGEWGQAHGHGLLWLSGGLRDGDITALSRSWRALPGNGYIWLQVPLSMEDVVSYCAKHAVKQLNELALSIGCGRQWYAEFVGQDGPPRAGAGASLGWEPGAEAIP